MKGIELQDQVVAITGGGRGLGASYAKLLAGRGARILVNDVDAAAARETADAIRAAGGVAEANNFDVTVSEEAGNIIKHAIDAFGAIDGLICNAGFLRDRTFKKMSVREFDEIIDVHLRGAAYVLHAAWPHMIEKGFGRVVLTASASALWGNFGQANYDAAKLGLVGMMNALKLEGAKHDILINTIAPLARTRLSAELLEGGPSAILDPEQVAGLVCYLCSRDCSWTGEIFELGGGVISRVQLVRSAGIYADFSTPEAVRNQAAQLIQQKPSLHFYNAPTSLEDMLALATRFSKLPRPSYGSDDER